MDMLAAEAKSYHLFNTVAIGWDGEYDVIVCHRLAVACATIAIKFACGVKVNPTVYRNVMSPR